MPPVLDIKEHGALDWRIREISATLDSIRKAIEDQTNAIRDQTQVIASIAEQLPVAGRGL